MLTKSSLRATAFVVVLAVAAACGGGPAITGGPQATGPVVPSIAIPSIAIPSIAIPSPGERPDPELAARFPTALEGATLGEVETSGYLDIIVSFVGPEAAQQFVGAVNAAGMDANALSFGSQFITFDQNVVIQLQAVRAPGRDANAFISIWPQLSEILQPEETPPTISQTTIGGKTVTALTDENGEVDYLYVTGDVVWRITGGDEAQITTILNALR